MPNRKKLIEVALPLDAIYMVCERERRTQEALSYNALVQSWPEIQRLARKPDISEPVQTEFL